MVTIENEIAGRIALTKADLIAQLHLLSWRCQNFEWDEWSKVLVGKIIAGIAILGAADMPADQLAALIARIEGKPSI